MEKFSSLLSTNGTKVLITGDSLSYNYYDFDPVHKKEASNCYSGMPSWSTLTFEAIYQNDPSYKFGNDISINGCKSLTNMLPNCDEPMCMLLRSRTAIIDIGEPGRYQGWERFMIVLNVTGSHTHFIQFQNIKCVGKAYITLAGVGSRGVEVYHSGIGSTTVSYFVENFEVRINKYKPDIFIFSIGSNDRALLSPKQFKDNLQKLTNMILECSPDCKFLFIAPGRSLSYDKPGPNDPVDIAGKVGKERSTYLSQYNNIINQHAKKTGAACIDMLTLFNEIPISKWRFENTHLTKYGNTILAKQVIRTLMPNGYYIEELIDADRKN